MLREQSEEQKCTRVIHNKTPQPLYTQDLSTHNVSFLCSHHTHTHMERREIGRGIAQ